MTIIDPKNGKPIPKKREPFTPLPDGRNFRAQFDMPHGKKLVRSTPITLVVVGSVNEDGVRLAMQLKFRDGMVISGGPVDMKSLPEGGADGQEGEVPGDGDSGGSPGAGSLGG